MIAVDTSAIVASALGEPEIVAFDKAIERHKALVGTPTLFEVASVLATRMPGQHRRFLDRFMARRSVSVIPFEQRHLLAAMEGLERFGKGRGHPAQLNLGDCLSYAVAKVHGLPLLFKGDDFTHADIEPAVAP